MWRLIRIVGLIAFSIYFVVMLHIWFAGMKQHSHKPVAVTITIPA